MSGGKTHIQGLGDYSEFRFTPDELDRYEVVNTNILSVSPTWVGTTAAVAADATSALVLINRLLDHPRNLLYGAVGTADHGGTWIINGIDQFGATTRETVGSGTVAAGTPAFAVAGTKIFREVTSGTFTGATGGVGNILPRLGVAIGTATTAKHRIGLLTKIAGSTDVKAITWIKENVPTTMNGGTIGALVDVTNHAFSGSAIIGGTESFKVIIRPTFDNSSQSTDLAA